eukprot:COSAG01_NODE_4080_length_5376_cov_171.292401_5_plen_241_part_00
MQSVSGSDQLLATEIWNAFKQRGLECSKPGCNPVLSVWMSEEQNFAFVEFITAEDATNALLLDGMAFMAQPIRVSRPSDYVPSVQSQAVAQQLLMQSAMQDPAKIALLQQNIVQQAAAQAGAGAVAPAAAPVTPTTVLVLSNLTGPDTADADLDDILEDVDEEARSAGAVESSLIVRAATLAAAQAARGESIVGDVMVKFGSVESAHKCYTALHGRMFAGNQVKGSFVEPATYDTIKSAV